MANLENFNERDTRTKRVLTSPRSIEACRREGVEPSELLVRSRASFAQKGQSASLQRKRHEHSEIRRRERIAQCRQTRRRIIEQERERQVEDAYQQHGGSGGHEGHGNTTSGSGLGANDTSDLIKLDEEELERVKRRQQRELEKMLAFEMEQARHREESMRRMAREQARQVRLHRRDRVDLAHGVAFAPHAHVVIVGVCPHQCPQPHQSMSDDSRPPPACTAAATLSRNSLGTEAC